MNSSKRNNQNSRPPKKRHPKSDSSQASGNRKSGGAPRKYTKNTPKRPETDAMDPIPGNQNWGGLARKGVLRVHHDDIKAIEEQNQKPHEAKEAIEDEDILRLREERAQKREQRDARKRELQAEAKAALERANSNQTRKETKPKKSNLKKPYKRKPLAQRRNSYSDVKASLRKVLGPTNGQKAYKRLKEADAFFQQERFPEAKKKLTPLLRTAANVSEVQELHGLICYRTNDYQTAAFSLEQFRSLAQSTERHPILMDCYRSEKRWADVKVLWDELADVSPDAPTVAEGKIIYANSFADQGNYPKAINILEKGWSAPARPQEHHLRKAYALADLYDRAGMPIKARELFSWITSKSGSYLDASDRYRQLS
jgi:hypothetical protein